jgi:ATP-dependent helicase HepA
LLEGKKTATAVKELVARFPNDPSLKEIEHPDEMLMHLAETYSLSDRLIRNRRVRVGGFSARKQALMQLLHPGNMGQKFQALHALRD